MWSYICPELLKAIEAEPEMDVLSEDFQALARCVELLGVGCLNDEQMGNLVKVMNKTFEEHFSKQVSRKFGLLSFFLAEGLNVVVNTKEIYSNNNVYRLRSAVYC